MQLEVGKRYVLRNGEVTGSLEHCESLRGWLKDSRRTWREDGMWSSADATGAYDIVSEYSEPSSDPVNDIEPQPEPQPKPLRWVENTKPDKPGIWARLHGSIISVMALYPDNWQSFDDATRCYLGPIPEILPPMKKVVQRLWLEPIKRTAQNAMEFEEAWFVDGETIQPPGDWIRTDRTREVEQ